MISPLKKWRDERDLTQEQLAAILQVEPMTVSRWERGGHLPRKKHWPKIEKETGIAPSDLVEFVQKLERA